MQKIFDADQTARLLPYRELIEAIRVAALDYASGKIICPERTAISLGDSAVMLSMPAKASEITIHKLSNISPGNANNALPVVHGQVSAWKVPTGEPLFTLDGATLTARRTAALSMVGIQTLAPRPPRSILLIGTGSLASAHVEALATLYPETSIYIKGSSERRTKEFCARYQKLGQTAEPYEDVANTIEPDVIVTLTSSKVPVYLRRDAGTNLIVAVGVYTPNAAEVASDIVRSSTLVVDDPNGAREEAGDFSRPGSIGVQSAHWLMSFSSQSQRPFQSFSRQSAVRHGTLLPAVLPEMSSRFPEGLPAWSMS